MSIFQLGDEQQYIFYKNEAFSCTPIQISYSMEFSKKFSPEELIFAVDKCISSADVFGAKCLIQNGRPYIEFLPYHTKTIHFFDFSSKEEYQDFCNQARVTEINNRDKLYYIFIFSISGSNYHLHFIFNHLIVDASSLLLLCEKIQKVLVNNHEEVQWYPYSSYLNSIQKYRESEKYQLDKEFWETRFFEISKCEFLFQDAMDTNTSQINELAFQTSIKFKEDLFVYCNSNNISPYVLITTFLAKKLNDKKGCEHFVIEIPIGNRLGQNEKNSIGTYEIAFPFIFDFSQYNTIFDLLASIKKQAKEYFKHRYFDWNTKIYSEEYEKKYGIYTAQVSISYFCFNKKLDVQLATLHYNHCDSDIIPITLYVSDYLDWQTMTFSYMYWSKYFTDDEIVKIHSDMVSDMVDIFKN